MPSSFLVFVLFFCLSLHCQSQEVSQQPLIDDFPISSFQEPRLNFSSPAPHIFSSVHGFLRQGYNTFFRNGFSVAPCEIPPFTSFYHGWLNDEPPKSPEWLASTPEMAYGIMGSTRNSFLSVYQTTQSAKCLYFDGASGALSENGTMDTQMLALYGNTTGPPGRNSSAEFLWDEYARAQQLCGWLHEKGLDAPGRGIEGIVRMSAGFELIWCNFSSPSLRLVYRLNVSVPLLEYNRTSSVSKRSVKSSRALSSNDSNKDDPVDLPAPDWDIDWEHEPFVASQQWDWFTSTSRTYANEDLSSNREPTISLLDGEIVSLYSPEYSRLLNALAEHEREDLNLTSDGIWQGVSGRQARQDALDRLMRRRSAHRPGNIHPQESDKFHQEIEQMVSRVVSHDSQYSNAARAISIPWSRISDTIVLNFAKPLLHFQKLLHHQLLALCDQPVYTQRRFALLRERAHALLMPYFRYSSDMEKDSGIDGQPRSMKTSIDRCKLAYLPMPVLNKVRSANSKTKNIDFVAQAVAEVLDSICSVLIGIGQSIEGTWRKGFNDDTGEIGKDVLQGLHVEMRVWLERIEELTAWLGWAPHWIGCERKCEWDEECYIPMWPVLRQMSPEKPAYGNRPIDPEEIEYDLWHPRCIKITDFATR